MSVWNGLAANVVPPGNFHYMQQLRDGKTFKIEGFAGWDELAKNVLRFRLEQIVLVDPARANPEAVTEDIVAFVCQNYPAVCLTRWQAPQPASHASGEDQTFKVHIPLIQRISEWIGQLGETGVSFIPIAEADRRAAICAKCQYNIRWESGCGPCVAEIRQNTTRILAHRTTRHDKDLKGCQRLRWLNRISVWLDLEKEHNDSLPSHCWHKAQ